MDLLGTPSTNSPCILYQAYGGSSYRDQAAFSLLTLHGLAPAAPIRTIVFTDVPERFAGLAHEIIDFSAAEAKADMGRFRYLHRVKIQILRRAAARFHSAVSWMLVDGDTVWSGPPDGLLDKLHQGCAVMWKEEGMVGPTFHGKLQRTLKRIRPKDSEFVMRNAGVLGIPNAGGPCALEETLALTDELLVQCLQRGWVEQAAFNIVLPRYYSIVCADETIRHYWDLNKEMADVLRLFFAGIAGLDPRAQAEAATAFDPILPARAVQLALRQTKPQWRQRLVALRRSWEKRKIDVDALWARYQRSRSPAP
jgi:hypothetical protein